MCMCFARGGVGGEGVSGLVWALPIPWGQQEYWTCVCVWVAVMWVVGCCGVMSE